MLGADRTSWYRIEPRTHEGRFGFWLNERSFVKPRIGRRPENLDQPRRPLPPRFAHVLTRQATTSPARAATA